MDVTMQMNDSQTIPASRETVWAALNDPEILKQCIPGCQTLEMTSPSQMTAKVVIKVGPVKANFSGNVTLTDLDPPNSYKITGEGSGGVAGFAKGGATIRLDAISDKQTMLSYEVDSQIGGKLAQLGGRQETGERVLFKIRCGRKRRPVGLRLTDLQGGPGRLTARDPAEFDRKAQHHRIDQAKRLAMSRAAA
jgi:carbon monoxide dehydrogenase subunit G